jgi:hypothetical protein
LTSVIFQMVISQNCKLTAHDEFAAYQVQCFHVSR